jgi:hypothetical protein
VPSGGNSELPLLRIVIQWAASHFFAGRVKEENVLPANKTIVSPQEADCRAASTPLPSCTLISSPDEGVDVSAVLIHRVGNAAGPSLLVPKSVESPNQQYRLSGWATAVLPTISSARNSSFLIAPVRQSNCFLMNAAVFMYVDTLSFQTNKKSHVDRQGGQRCCYRNQVWPITISLCEFLVEGFTVPFLQALASDSRSLLSHGYQLWKHEPRVTFCRGLIPVQISYTNRYTPAFVNFCN